MHHIELISAAMSEAARRQCSTMVLIPAMVGCPECRTASLIASPTALALCSGCGTQLIVLTFEQIAVAQR